MTALKIQYIINTISPVFIVIILGMILRLCGFFKDEITEGLNKLTYWIAMPVLLFQSVAQARYGFDSALGVFYVVMLGMAAAIAVSLAICLLFKMDKSSSAAFIQGAYRGNLIFIGLPIIAYSFSGSLSGGSGSAEQMAILSLSLAIPAYNAAAIIILLTCQHNIDMKMPLKVIQGLISNPLVLSAAGGFAYRRFFNGFPPAIDRSCEIIGTMAMPLALLSIGANLVSTKNASDYSCAIFASIIKTALCPLVGYWAAVMLGLSGSQTKIALLFLACPTAVSSYIMASQMGANARLSAAIIVISSVLSVGAIVAVLVYI